MCFFLIWGLQASLSILHKDYEFLSNIMKHLQQDCWNLTLGLRNINCAEVNRDRPFHLEPILTDTDSYRYRFLPIPILTDFENFNPTDTDTDTENWITYRYRLIILKK